MNTRCLVFSNVKLWLLSWLIFTLPIKAFSAPVPPVEQLFELPAPIVTTIERYIVPMRSKQDRLAALLQLTYDDNKLNMQYSNDVTRTPTQAIGVRRGNCVSLSFTFAAMARAAGLEVNFLETSDPGRWKQVGEHYALERHMSLYVPMRSNNSRGYYVDFQYAETDNLRHQKISDKRAIASFYNNRAVEHLLGNFVPEAKAFAEAALEHDPKYSSAWLNYGLILRHQQAYDEALKAYQKAIDIDPHNLSAYNNMLVLYRNQGNDTKAKKLESKVLAYRMKNPFYLHEFGEAELRSDNFEQAIKFFKKAIKIENNIPDFYLSLTEAYYLNNDFRKAIKTLRKANKRNFDTSWVTRFEQTELFLKDQQKLQQQDGR